MIPRSGKTSHVSPGAEHSGKPKLAAYWAASCGGCEVSLLNLDEEFLALTNVFDLVFCPCLIDTKRKDLESFPDESIDLTLFNGSVRNEENREMALLLRRKTRILSAYGSCASEGCVPGLANLFPAGSLFTHAYLENSTTPNPAGTVPQSHCLVPEGELELPRLCDRVSPLHEHVPVDCTIPGCPPEPHRVGQALRRLLSGLPLPHDGIIGAGNSTVCSECPKTRNAKKLLCLSRFTEIVPDPKLCLLEQGVLCMGIATRDGCGSLCPKADMPCTGCYGLPEGVADQGAAMASAIASILSFGDLRKPGQEEIFRRVNEIIGVIPDLAGTFYKYSLASSLLGKLQKESR